MQFGEYRGCPISEVPLDYLQWCYDTFSPSKRRTLIQIEIERRQRVSEYQRDYCDAASTDDTAPVNDDIPPEPKQDTISALLMQAEAIARQTGDDELASKILNLRLFGAVANTTDIPPIGLAMDSAIEAPPFDPPYTTTAATSADDPEAYRLPSGKYSGCYLRDLPTSTLQRVWAGYNGAVGCTDIADRIKVAITERARKNR